MPKIVLFAYECDPERGSEYSRSWNWAVLYAKAGYDVYCITSLRGKNGIERKLSEAPADKLHFVFVGLPAFLEKKYRKGLLWVYLHYLLWLIKSGKKALALHHQLCFDLSHHVSWGSIQQGSTLGRLNIPFIFGPVGGGQFAPEVLKKYFLSGWKTEVQRSLVSKLFLLFNPLTRQTMKKATLVLVVNEDTQRMANKLGASQVLQLADLNIQRDSRVETRSKASDPAKVRFLWVGRLLYRKGLLLVLETLAAVPHQYDFELSVYGDGPFGEQLTSTIERLGLTAKVRWYGQVPFQEVKAAYQSHDVFLFCSLRESLGLQYFEAMYYGLPVITLNLHGAKTAISPAAAIKVNVQSPQQVVKDLASAVVLMIEDPARRLSMAREARKTVESITKLDKVALVEKYLSIAQTSPAQVKS